MLLQVEQIAARIRELRDILGIDAADVAAAIEVSNEKYDDYENARKDIPIGKLYLIAKALGVDPTVLLAGDEPRMAEYAIVRGGRGIDVERYEGYRFSALAYNYVGREMEPMIVTLDPDDKPAALVVHGGQEFNMVLEGTVGVVIKDKEFVLEAGDSIYFNAGIPHGQRAIGGAKAKFLTVINEIKKSK